MEKNGKNTGNEIENKTGNKKMKYLEGTCKKQSKACKLVLKCRTLLMLILAAALLCNMLTDSTVWAGYKDCTEEVEGTLIGCTYSILPKDRVKLNLKYKYEYNGKEYEATYEKKTGNAFISGNRKVKPSSQQVDEYVNKNYKTHIVKINPNNPSEYTFLTKNTRNFRIIVFLFAGIVIFVSVIFVIMYTKKYKENTNVWK